MEEPNRSRRRQRIKRIGSVGVIIVLIIAGVLYWVIRPKQPRVTVAVIHKMTIQNQVFAAGDVYPVERQVVLQTDLPSPVSKVSVTVGEHVHQGQLLMTCQNAAQTSQLDAAETQYQQAQATLNQTQQQANATPLGLRAQFNGTLASLKSSLAQAQSQLASAQAAYNQTVIKATITGTVLSLSPDGLASDGSSAPVIEVVGPQKQVVVNVSEVDAVHVKAGERASVTSDAYPNHTWTATVKSVALFANNSNSGAGQVEVDLSLPQNCPIPLGYQVNANIISETHKNALTIPYSSLVQVGSQYMVYVMQGNRAVQIPVNLGITTDTAVEVTSGLKVGQEVVLNPPTNLSNGERVVVTGHD
ncbi:efflux RND transporter periplasmic adaptor subunit [Alicyclobacillus ferrooxydans]|uniref:Uncharacterized protein n=1 Tax=Alicyclobacillus ferrooxydans TaxID=471514 RepID=A0A0P9CYT9_9BACL|nr:efflux RND transporter periplasmic adaptor subunit [Alicyclobacillus ferrooxydans]KPV44906.1 hypothetical protein AN477_04620 [Alicyclobacillus ferrooxydans]